MDALLPGSDASAAASAFAVEPGRRVSGFIQAGGRAVVLVDPSAPARAAALDGILAALPAGAIRLGNPLASALTLHRLMFQLGIEDSGEDGGVDACEDGRADGGGLIVCALDVPTGARMAMLAVDDAHSLTPDAMAALAQVPSPASPDQAGRLLLLAGGPALLALVSGPGCEVLRDPCLTLTIVAPASATTVAPAPAGAVPLRASVFGVTPAPKAGADRRWWPGLLLAGSFLVGLIGMPILFWVTQAATPPGTQAAAAASPAASTPELDVAAATSARPPPQAAPDRPEGSVTSQPTLARADVRLRREFDAFLNRAGRDTANLSATARDRLFRDYLNWRTRNAGRPELRRPPTPETP